VFEIGSSSCELFPLSISRKVAWTEPPDCVCVPNKKKLIAAKTAGKGCQDYPGQCQITLMGGKSTQHQNSITFYKGTNQYRQVSVIFDQRFHLISLWLKSLGVADDKEFFFSF
jgi:hypothetical protein